MAEEHQLFFKTFVMKVMVLTVLHVSIQ